MQKLNFGSGEFRKEGYVNIDWNPLSNPDLVHDLNIMPYPFKDNTFDLVEAVHVLEHLDKPFMVMKELHRILKPNGKLLIKVPHFTRGFTHAEHAHGFDVTFPLYFNKSFTSSGYFGVEYKLEKMEMHWAAHIHLLKYIGYGAIARFFIKALNKIISFFANLSPAFCSRIWAFWVGGFEEIEFNFKCTKNNGIK